MLVMDVGSTKRDVVDGRAPRAARPRRLLRAGAPDRRAREVSGVDHADPDLYQGKQVILTPIEKTADRAAEEGAGAVGGAGMPRAADVARPARRDRSRR
jgi:prephenate dehydrogenase